MSCKVNFRGRKREARRWLEAARLHYLRIRPWTESYRVWMKAIADLEARDPVLCAAVYQCMDDERVKDLSLTYEEWQARAVQRSRRRRLAMR